MSEQVPEPAEVATGSRPQLADRAWAVIGDHYLNMNLTHAEALDEAKDLVANRKQHAVVVANEAALRMVQNNAGIAVASMPDMKF